MQELQLPLLNKQREPVETAIASITNDASASQHLKSLEEFNNYKTGVSGMMGAIEKFVEENTQEVFKVPFGINSFSLTQDDRHLIYGTTSGNVAIFSILKKMIKNDVPLSENPFYSILLTKDETHIVAVGAGGINVFSFPSLEHVTTLEGHEAPVIFVIQAPDGKTIFTCSEDSTVRSWSMTDFTGGEVLMRHDGMCKSLAKDPECRYLFSGGEDQLIRVYDFESQSEIMQLSGHSNWVWALAVSPDSRYLASGSSDASVILWNMTTFEQIRTFFGHTNRITALQFSPDSKYLVSASCDTTLRVWALNARNATRVLSGHTDWVKNLIISRDQKFIYSAGEDSTFRIWGFPTEIVDEELTSHSGAIRGLDIGDNGGTLITSGDDCVIKLWDLRADSYVKDIASTESNVRSAVLTKDGRLYIVATEQGFLHVFDMQTHTLVNSKQAHNCAIASMSISSDDSLLMTGGTTDSKVNIFYVDTLELKCALRGHSNWIWSNKFSHDNKNAITGSSDCTVKIWDIETRKCLESFTSLEARIDHISITKDDKNLVIGDNAGKVQIWNYHERRCETTINVHDSCITGIYITQDDRHLFTADLNGKLNIFDLKSRQNITSLSFNGLLCFTLDPEETCIFYSTNCKANYVKNPLKVTELSVIGNGVKYDYLTYLNKTIDTKGKVQQNLAMDDWIIMPYKINLLHIYAYYGMFEHLKSSIENRFSMIKSINNETPLTIALYRKSYEITEYLIDQLCDAAVTNKYIMTSIEDSLALLNLFGNSNLNRLYDSALRVSDDSSIPQFCTGNYNFPTYCLSDSFGINPINFIAEKDRSNEGEMIIFKESLVKYNLTPGSKWSIEFLTTLIDCPNQEIFRTKFIQSLLTHKWQKLRGYMYLQAFVFLIYMVALCTQILTGSTNIFLMAGIFIINLVLLVFEVFQMFVTGYRYWVDLWNFLDVIRLSACMIYYGLFLFGTAENEWDYELLGIVTLSSWLRGIAYFRLFQETRYMINLLTEVMKDMKAFMVLLVYSTLSFTFLFLVIKNEFNFTLFLIGIYNLNLGGLPEDFGGNIIEFTLLTVAVVVNPIVMLNLLISILGDTFDRVQSTMVIADMKELCEMVIELESLLYWRRETGGLQYLHCCNSRESQELREDLWEGKIRALDKKLASILDKVSTIDGSNKTIISKLEGLQTSIDALAKSKE